MADGNRKRGMPNTTQLRAAESELKKDVVEDNEKSNSLDWVEGPVTALFTQPCTTWKEED